MLEMKFAI